MYKHSLVSGLAVVAALVAPRQVRADAGLDFAQAVATRADAGYRLRQVEVAWVDGSPGAVHLSLVLVRGAEAMRDTLIVDADTETPIGFTSESAAMPEKLHQYRFEPQLFAALRTQVPTSFSEACGAPTLSFADGTLALPKDDYYLVERRVSGARAGAELAKTLASELEGTASLTAVAVQPGSVQGMRGGLNLTVDTGEARREIAVSFGEQGRVRSFEVRHGPAFPGAEYYEAEEELVAELVAARRIDRIDLVTPATLVDEESGEVVETSSWQAEPDIELTVDGEAVVIARAKFLSVNEEYG